MGQRDHEAESREQKLGKQKSDQFLLSVFCFLLSLEENERPLQSCRKGRLRYGSMALWVTRGGKGTDLEQRRAQPDRIEF